MVRRAKESERPVFEVYSKENVINMKNWELEQYLYAVQDDYAYGNDKLSSFRRSYPGKADDYIFMSRYDTIDYAIKYIEELEAKVDELSYAQKIIDEVIQNDKRSTNLLSQHS